jgi:quinol monooxygenase YgiN
MIIIAGHLVTKPELVDDFIAALNLLVDDTRREDGCLDYNFAIQDRAAGEVLVYERWRDQQALDAHLAVPQVGALLGGWADKIEIRVTKFDASNARGFTE